MHEELTSRRTTVIFVVLTVINLFLLTTHLNIYIRAAKNILWYLAHPTAAVAGHVFVTTHTVSQTLHEIFRVHQDNLALQENLRRYVQLDQDYQRMKDENDRLRQLLNFTASRHDRYIVARVAARDPAHWFQWVTIDKGFDDGIPADAPVLVWYGNRPAVLGRVGEQTPHTAKVVLITNTLSALPVQVRRSGEDGLLEGLNGPGMQINYLLTQGGIAIGDEVVTSPLSAVFPEGITIGYVQDVTGADNETMRMASVRPAVNFNRLREVIIIAGSGGGA